MLKPMVSLREASDLFGISYYALRQLALSGAIPAIRIGRGKILVNSDKLAEYLNTARLTDNKDEQPDTIRGIRVIGR